MRTKPKVDMDLAKRIADLVDGDDWALADLLAEEFPAEEWGDPSSKRNSGLYAALHSYAVKIRDTWGVELSEPSMRNHRATALAWPHARRSASASYDAHRAIRSPDRFEKMDRYLAHNGGRGLSAKDVTRMNADNRPRPPLTPWETKVARRFESTARSLMLGAVKTDRPDWWNADVVNDESRATVARALHDLANRIMS